MNSATACSTSTGAGRVIFSFPAAPNVAPNVATAGLAQWTSKSTHNIDFVLASLPQQGVNTAAGTNAQQKCDRINIKLTDANKPIVG